MQIIKIRYFTSIICLVSGVSFAQQAIPFTRSSTCDTAIKSYNAIKIEIGDLQCIEDPGKDQVIYFTKKQEFQSYTHKNKISRGYCSDKPEMVFDFNKNDVILIRTEIMGGLSHNSYKVFEKNGNYIINLNFFSEKQNKEIIEHDSLVERQVIGVRHIYSSYLLLPKGKVNTPELHIYEVFYKCF